MRFVTLDSINRFLRILGNSIIEEKVNQECDLLLEEEFLRLEHNSMMYSSHSYDNDI